MTVPSPESSPITLLSPSILLLALPILAALLIPTLLSSKTAGISHIPGPFLARYTGAWSLWLTWKSHRNGDRTANRPRSVTVLDPAAVPLVYGVRAKLDKGPAYIPFRQAGVKTSLLSIPDEHTHSKYRKLVSHTYSMTSIKGYEPYVDRMVRKFIASCDEHATSKEPMNLSLWCHYYCFDVISSLTLGSPIGCLDGKDVFGLIERIRAFRDYASVVSQMPWLHRVFQDNPLLRRVKPSPFMKLVKSTIEDRFRQSTEAKANSRSGSDRPDLLSHFVATHDVHPGLMTKEQVAISAGGNFIAGGLSPAATFNELCYYLATTPEAQEKLHTELSDAQCSYPAPFDQVKAIPYLDGIVREAYRLHSSSSATLQRVTGPSGLTLPNGCRLPPGVYVGCSVGTVNRDKGVFGADAEIYNPARWIKGSGEDEAEYEERRKAMERTDLSFGQGSRSCIGKSIAQMEISKVVAALVGMFKFEVVGVARKSELYVAIQRRKGREVE
ncbi:cytochrome P450 [Aspergillus carlsbadensis]|nr:cytochrome P450 [Aspergillus carlsbadensis]